MQQLYASVTSIHLPNFGAILRQTADDATIAGAANKESQIHTWTEIIDYKINKRFDVYAAGTQNHFQGAAVTPSSYAATSVSAYGLGVRMKF